ncbi:hypothetical protein Syn7502_03633 (plasmid) [Synechococcus sp. PCC 7502]|uniref:hypothetical protein n=1 Tax=Synechococcus sp. PCC 7502 TaxID=1173263 RepID=UPI00029FCCA6|nr:hypothetical protein [Synechococcus sp. PCC 7502]AFY75459.1 hypothetical protein Syn7502_03633 [Synechococcus sp. PCC 7502]
MPKQRVRLTEKNDPLTSTESVFAVFEQASKSTSQQVENIAVQEVDNTALSVAEKSASREVKKIVLRKSTFQLSEEILKQLDIYHLQLQLEMGKADAPYKEVIVEEAISQFLSNSDTKSLEKLLKRQKTR